MNRVNGNKYAHLKHCKKYVVNFDFVLRYYELMAYHYKKVISIP
jgi:hypothetical protein